MSNPNGQWFWNILKWIIELATAEVSGIETKKNGVNFTTEH